MRHNISVSLIRLSILVVALWCDVLTASAQTTAFSYQGQLNDGGSPANGSYDIQFKLFDSLAAGTQIGSTVSLTSVAVSSGIFTVTLDFGASSFPGANRWLEISVRLAGGGTFTTLTPRQQLTSTPYAIKSLNAVSADGLSNACVGCVSGTQIGSLPTSSSNYIQNTTTQQASSNFNISGNGLIGGNVGIGIQIPEQKLSVSGGLNIDQDNANNSVIRQNMLTFGSNSGEGIASKRTTVTGNPFGLDFFTNNAIRMSISNAGNVGIGTTIPPLGRLQVTTANDMDPTNIAGWDARHFVVGGSSNTGGIAMSYDQTKGTGYIEALSPGVSFRNLILQFGGGNVGIGALMPESKLTVISNLSGEFSPPAIYGENTFGNGVRGYGRTGIYGASDNLLGTGVTGSNQNGIGVRGTSINGTGVSGAGAVAGVYGESSASGGVGVFGKSTSGLAGRFDGNVVVNGNVGINTNPAEKLHVAGAFLRVDGAGDERAYLGGDGAGNDVQLGSSNPNVLDVRIYNSALTRHMNLFVGTLTITGGADLAEPFDVGSADTLKPGLVVAIDPAQPGHLRITDKAYDRTVVGIISGAGGVKPGMMMSQSKTIADGTQPVALSGRVYCWADASNGAIKPGDLLTTSTTPGHAMKVTNHAKAQGAIIGKAMTTLKEGKGLVLVLVTLQ